jgi:hypothetical protein
MLDLDERTNKKNGDGRNAFPWIQNEDAERNKDSY